VTLRRLAPALALAALACARPGNGIRAEQTADPFPCPAELREGVDFWKNVWSRWTLAQVVLHDTEHPSIVYEVFELPPPAGDLYTDEQRAFVKDRREALAARLAAVERRVAAGEALEDDEKALVLKITAIAGTEGLSGASERVRSQRGLRERFRRGLEISGRYHDAFVRAFRDAGLPDDLANLPHVESSFQVQARSSAGAVGVWQFTRGAARKFMLMTSGVDERLDPVASARGAARYLGSAYAELGSWPLAITSYNHGVEGMKVARDRFGTDFVRILGEYDGRTFGFASKNFYKEFLAAREIVKDPRSYFPEGIAYEAPLAYDRVTLDSALPAASVGGRYGVTLDALAAINPAWTSRAVRGRSPLPAGTHVWLPEGTLERIAQAAKPPRPRAHRTVATVAVPSLSTTERFAIHVVQKGETLFRIATSYGVSLAKLVDVNGIAMHATIHPGQELRIPVLR
jgi:membrane-bound lytic murein transglycosylase D